MAGHALEPERYKTSLTRQTHQRKITKFKMTAGGLNLLDKTYVFNAVITAPADATPGSTLQGKVVFDTTVADIHIQAATLKLECLEFHITPPTTPEYNEATPAVTGTQDAHATTHHENHHLNFLTFFHKHGKAPKKAKKTALSLVSHEDHLPNEIKFESTISLIPASENNTVIKPGRHEYEFSINLPQNLPLTTAVDRASNDVVLIVSRLHAVIQIENVKEEVFSVLHVLPK
ncbi:hypothetical protein BDR26DRAFT_865509 [Obelidium mucronatum]|nr:hypothetical protein BDR26DRAFT_865509 [Obelidium mucronatum]